METVLYLPWPPSCNTYYRHTRNGRVYISPKGIKYRLAVGAELAGLGWPRLFGEVSVHIDAYPPDRRERDLDNIRKATYDAISDRIVKGHIVHRGLMASDKQIRQDSGQMCDPIPGGKIIITIKEIKHG